MIINIDEIIKVYEKKHGPIEVDGYYGEQFTIEQDGVILYQGIGEWRTYREVWECSKRILDVKEDNNEKIRKAKKRKRRTR